MKIPIRSSAKRIRYRKDMKMRKISFNGFKNLPKKVLVMWIAACALALTGLVLMVMNMLGTGNIPLAAAMALIVAGQVINIFGIGRYKDRLYK